MLGLGCMRLSTDADRDDARALAVLEAALDSGIELLDTADAYAHDEHDIGHNERLIARAIVATTWSPDGAPGEGLDARLREIVGLPLAIARCTHPAGPPICWCRKPLPGLGLWLAREHQLDLARSVHVGRGPADRGFALRVGVPYVDVADGFPLPGADE